jgi:hypothetical protein
LGHDGGTGQDCVYELGCNADSSSKPWIPAVVARNVQSAAMPLTAGITSPLIMNLSSLASSVADHHPVIGQW